MASDPADAKLACLLCKCECMLQITRVQVKVR